MTKIHLDTDLGGDADDVCALAMLLKWPDVEIIGITTVAEENGRRAGYTKYLLKLAGREDIPVKAGADVSGGYYRFKPGYPDENENWPEAIAPLFTPVDEAIELLKHSIEQEALIIAIGQYTNLFLLDQKYPGILKKAKLYLMGGYIYPVREGFPPWGNDFDYNIQLDVQSAKYVLENSNPLLIPLSVTVETAVRRSHLPALKESGKLGELVARQVETLDRTYQNEEKIGKVYSGVPDDLLNFLHDPLACAIALGWTGPTTGVLLEELPLNFEIKDGYLYESILLKGEPKGKLTQVVTQVDGDAFNEFWLEMMTR
jgi:purine nucleosidase